MFEVTRTHAARIDVVVNGKLDADAAAQLIHSLFRNADGITQGHMLVDIEQLALPTLGAVKVELSLLPEVIRFTRRFSHVAVLADAAWVRMISTIESRLIPGLVIKAFPREQRYHAETWLANQPAAVHAS